MDKIIIRPSVRETDKDLIELDAALRKELAESQERAKNKNATDADDSKIEALKRKSSDKEKTKNKKKKESIVDYTVLEEAVMDTKKKSAVLGKIVVRDVTGDAEYLKKFTIPSHKNGFPTAPTLTILNNPKTAKQPGKSLYMQQLEMEGRNKNKHGATRNKTDLPQGMVDYNMMDVSTAEKTAESGFSCNLDSQPTRCLKESDKIHQENKSIIESMSEKEIQEAKNSLMQKLNPESIQFIKNLKKTHSSNQKMDTKGSAMTTDADMKTSDVQHGLAKSKEDESSTLSNLNLPVQLGPLLTSGIEYNKLEWMSEVPKPKPLKNGQGYTARFNLNGDLLPYDTDISVQEGLHHHGDEPGRAGYTVDELFIFARSNVIQQRHFGLKLIANILRNAKEGLYDKCFDESIIQLMIDAGLVIFLRYAIDESSALVYQEGIRAMYYLVCSEPDEHCLDLVSSWSPNSTVPGVSSKSHSKIKDRKELDEEERELKDVELLQLDVIRALIRMDTHVRLRYFLLDVKPSPPDVINIFGILSRMVRHSSKVAWTIATCPRLISGIYENFMPHSLDSLLTGSNSLNVKTAYGIPLRHAVKFLRVLCERDRNLASMVENKLPNVMKTILSYLSIEPTEFHMPQVEIMHLAIESYSFWATLLSYCTKQAQDAFLSFGSMILKHLLFYRDKVNADAGAEDKFNFDIGTKLGDVFTRALHIASKYSQMNYKHRNSIPIAFNETGKPLMVCPSVLKWDVFNDIFQLVQFCLKKWFTQLSRSSGSFPALKMVGSFVNFAAVYIVNWRFQDEFEMEWLLAEVANAFQIVKPFVLSNNFTTLLRKLKKYSMLCSDMASGEGRDPHNLSSLGSVTRGGEVIPLVQMDTPFNILLPLTSFMSILLAQNVSVDDAVLEGLMENEIILDYVTLVNKSHSTISGNWFARIEISTICNFIQLAAHKGKNAKLFHTTAINLLPLIQKGDEHLIVDLVNNVICNKSFFADFLSIESRVGSLRIENVIKLPSPAISQSDKASDLSMITHQYLHSTGKIIIDSALTAREIDISCMQKNGASIFIQSLTRDFPDTSSKLDGYWILLRLRNLAMEAKCNKPNLPDLDLVPSVRKILNLTYLFLRHRNESMFRHTNVTGWYRYLSLVFTVTNDLFLDSQISLSTQACLRELLKNGCHMEIQPTVSLPDMPFCLDWYQNLLEQFSGVSCYDSTFALFVMIPMQMTWPETYRIMLWDDFMSALTFIKLSCVQVDNFVPVKQFIEPLEKNEVVIKCYHRALQSGFLSPNRTPFLYYVAYHHVTNHESKS